MVSDPKFPIRIEYSDGTESEIFDNEVELACTLEWFDSDDDDYHAKVIDAKNRSVRLVVRKLEIIEFALK